MKELRGGIGMPPLSLLIKPASSACNLKCTYCFYHSLSESREVKSYGIMREEVLENMVKRVLNEADEHCSFAFQGGEPTLAGLEFFEKLTGFQKKYNHKRLKIYNSIQTNGTLIDEKWAKFLSENNFLVGLSIDGPKEIHNLNRKDCLGLDTFNKVEKTAELFKKYNVEFNILCVVTSNTAKHVKKVYKYFKEKDFKFLQFINCLDPLYEEWGSYKYSLKPKDYSKFLKELFDEWYKDFMNGNRISIRYFDSLLETMIFGKSSSCGMNGTCTCQFVIESDGGVYPCDFYVLDKWKLGNIEDITMKELFETKTNHEFIKSSFKIDEECKKCRWFTLCKGGCRRCRDSKEDSELDLNYYCQSYKDFFEYALPRLINVANTIK